MIRLVLLAVTLFFIAPSLSVSADSDYVIRRDGLTSAYYRLARGYPVRIGLYGSSTYAGWWSSNGESGANPASGPGFWLQRTLRAYYGNDGVYVQTNAVAGSNTTDALKNWESQMAATDNEYIVIGWGSNDSANISPDEYRHNLIALAAIARKYNKITVFDTPHQTPAHGGTRLDLIPVYAAIMRDVAETLTIPVIDSHRWSLAVYQAGISLPEWISDGLHMSRCGLAAKGQLMALLFIPSAPTSSAGGSIISTVLPAWRVTDPATLIGTTSPMRSSRSGRSFRLAFITTAARSDLVVSFAAPPCDIAIRVDGIASGDASNPQSGGDGDPISPIWPEDVTVGVALLPGLHLLEIDFVSDQIIHYARVTTADDRAGDAATTHLHAFGACAPNDGGEGPDRNRRPPR